MHSEYINFIVTPITSGLIGYTTNWLAIKMLFRPYSAKWYTLGWQGVIPRNRKELSKNVSDMISSKLITTADMEEQLGDKDFYDKVYKSVSDFLGSLDIGLTNNGLKVDLSPQVLSIISDNAFICKVDNSLTNIFNCMLTNFMSTYKISDLNKHFSLDEKSLIISDNISELLSIVFDKLLTSDKSLDQYFQPDLDKLEDLIVSFINSLISDLSGNQKILESIFNFVLLYKKEIISDASLVESAMLRMLLSDKKIKKLVNVNIRDFIEKFMDDEVIQTGLREYVHGRLKYLLSTPLVDLDIKGSIASMGYDANKILEEFFNTVISSNIKAFLANNSDLTMDKLLEKYSISMDTIIPKSIPFTKFIIGCLTLSNSCAYCPDLGISCVDTKSNQIVLSNKRLTEKITSWLIGSILTFTSKIIKTINIQKLVEDKVDSLDLSELEDMLLSFMGKHFKWINILGFIIGFFVGLFQVSLVSVI